MIWDWRYHRLRARLRWAGRSRPEPTRETLLEGREMFERIAEFMGPPEGFTLRPEDAGGVPVEWMTSERSHPDRVLLYLHGGAYAMGSIRASRTMVGHLVEACGATALSVEYRLAPEHPFPAALDDALAAYRWLLERVPAEQVVVAGDSAGGGLSVALLVAARDEGLPMPAGCAITSAWADLGLSGRSYDERARRDLALTPASLATAARHYLDGTDPSHPLASPVHADLAGLPPLLVMVGTEEIVLDDSLTIAENAAAVGVDVTLHVADRMLHCWTGYAELRQAQRDLRRLGEWVAHKVPVGAA